MKKVSRADLYLLSNCLKHKQILLKTLEVNTKIMQCLVEKLETESYLIYVSDM